MSFMNVKKTVSSVEDFIKNANEVPGKLKYTTEPGTKHRIYIPTKQVTTIVDGKPKTTDSVIAMEVPIHNVSTIDGKYKGTYCTKGLIDETGKEMRCPYCENISKAWDVVNYLIAREEQNCTITNQKEREAYLDKRRKDIRSTLKVGKPQRMIYMLVAQYPLDGSGKAIENANSGLPVYQLKVMRISMSRLETLQTCAKDAEYQGIEGAEFIFSYDNNEPRFRKSVDTAVAPERRFVVKKPALKEIIDKEAAAFDMSTISNIFTELRDVPVAEKDAVVSGLFAGWDKYLLELQSDPNAVYLENKGAENIPITAPQGTVPTIGVDPDALFSEQAKVHTVPEKGSILP